MSEDDRYRIESRLRQQGRGLAPTPEDIEELRERQRQADKLLAKAPERAFDAYLDEPPAQDGQQEQGAGAEEGGEPKDAQAQDAKADEDQLESKVPPTIKPKAAPSAAPIPGAAQRAHQAGAMQAMLNQRLAQKQAAPPQEPRRASFFDRSTTKGPLKK